MDAFLFRVKAAQRDLIERCGGILRAEQLTGFSKSHVGRWNNPNDPDLMPLGAVRALEADCGQPLVTAVMAEANGRRLTDPEEERRSQANVMVALAEAMRNSAEVMHAAAMAMADGEITPTEATAVDRALSQQERSISDLRNGLAVIKALGGQKSGLRVVTGEGGE